jgi:GrpB-like predicted nucleotidyltransferase (UPF0157 family)
MIDKYWKKIIRAGIPDNVVHLKPYKVIWKWMYRLEKFRLKTSLDGFVVDIQHVGSTAIPGMPAKPIIDICIAIADYRAAMRCVHLIERIGYKYKGENDSLQQHLFVKGQPTAYYLYMVESGNEILKNGVYFRNFLIQHPDIASNYVTLKQKFAKRFATDRREYQQAKRSFVQQVIEMTRSENINTV